MAGKGGGFYTCSQSRPSQPSCPTARPRRCKALVKPMTTLSPTKEEPSAVTHSPTTNLQEQPDGCMGRGSPAPEGAAAMLTSLARSPLLAVHPKSPPANPLDCCTPCLSCSPPPGGLPPPHLLTNWLEKEEKGHALFCCLC